MRHLVFVSLSWPNLWGREWEGMLQVLSFSFMSRPMSSAVLTYTTFSRAPPTSFWQQLVSALCVSSLGTFPKLWEPSQVISHWKFIQKMSGWSLHYLRNWLILKGNIQYLFLYLPCSTVIEIIWDLDSDSWHYTLVCFVISKRSKVTQVTVNNYH